MATEALVAHHKLAVLLVDLDPPYSYALAARCVATGIRAVPVSSSSLSIPSGYRFALCVVALSGRDTPLDIVESLAKALPASAIVVLATDLGLEKALEVTRFGVGEVIELPSQAPDVATRAFAHAIATEHNSEDPDFVGVSPAMSRVRARIAAACRVTSTVLIQGETGTGKGVVARRIHEGSERRDRPFVHVDCGALAPNLIESELFGHERGAFTGASMMRRGRFETAELGTVFLDEIGELSLQLQAKLLRVLEERMFERVGGSVPMRLHARVIAATNRDLRAGVRAGTFRPDLFFRLNVLAIDVPSLRDRASDIPLLVSAGLRRICETHGVPMPRVSDEVLSLLSAQRWPGNVRELLNLLERLAIEQRVALFDVDELAALLGEPESLEPLPFPIDGSEELSAAELRDAERVRGVLQETGGNLSRTARRLEIPRSTLRHRIAKYKLSHLVPKD